MVVLYCSYFIVEFEDMKVNSESGFGCKTFQLTALSLAVVKLVSVPGGRMGEGDQWISTCAGVESRRALLL